MSAFKFLGNSLIEISLPTTLVCMELFSSMPIYLYMPVQLGEYRFIFYVV